MTRRKTKGASNNVLSDSPKLSDLSNNSYNSCYGDSCNIGGLNNSANPLNSLSFDINSLIPYEDVNWVCVEGLDGIYKSTMQAYANLVKQLAERIAKLEERIDSQIGMIGESTSNQVDRIESDIDSINQRIKGQLDSLGFSLVKNYYANPSQCCWYIIYRHNSNNQWIPLLEQQQERPIERPSYGPFNSLDEAVRVVQFFRVPLLDQHSTNDPESSTYNPDLQGSIDAFLEGIRNGMPTDNRVINPAGLQSQMEYDYGLSYPVADIPSASGLLSTVVSSVGMVNESLPISAAGQDTKRVPSVSNSGIGGIPENYGQGDDRNTMDFGGQAFNDSDRPIGEDYPNQSNPGASIVINQPVNVPASQAASQSQCCPAVDLTPLINAIVSCCESIGSMIAKREPIVIQSPDGTSSVIDNAGSSDIEYLYSPESQIEISRRLEQNGVNVDSTQLSPTIGKALEDTIADMLKESSANV